MYTRPKMFLPNRIATFLVIIAGAAAAVLPWLASMDWMSVAGVITGAVVACAGVVTWLFGWQKHEQANLAEYRRPEVLPTSEFTGEPDEIRRLRQDIDHVRADLELLSAHMSQITEEFAKR